MTSSGQSARFDRDFHAGIAAFDEGNFQEAVNRFQAALRAGVGHRETEAEIRWRLSDALVKLGRRGVTLAAVLKYEDAEEFAALGPALQTRVLLRLGWGRIFNNEVPRAIATFNQALQLARNIDDPGLTGECHAGLGRAYSVFSELPLARDHYERAREWFRQVGDWRKLAEAYVNIGFIQAREGDYETAINTLRQALTIIGERDEPHLIGRAHWFLSVSYDSLGRNAEAIAAAEICIASFERAGDVLLAALNQNNFAMQLLRGCQWERAERVIREVLPKVESRESVAAYGGALDSLGQLHMLRGDLDEAERLLNAALEVLTSSTNNLWASVMTRTALGRLLLMRGRPEVAMPHLESAVESASRRGERQDLPEAQLWLAEALLATGRVSEARDLVESVQAQQRQSPNILAWGLMTRVAAKLAAAEGQMGEAAHHLAQSSSAYLFRKNLYEYAVNLLILAEWRSAAGLPDEAARLTETALTEFERLGAAHDVRRARAFMAGLAGVVDRPIESSGWRAPADRPVSVVNDHTVSRLLRASALPSLLLYEMAEVARLGCHARGAIVAGVRADGSLELIAAAALEESEAAARLRSLATVAAAAYEQQAAYRFGDNNGGSYLLHLVEPGSDSTQELRALVLLVEQCLETNGLKAASLKAQRFNAARLLADVKMTGFVCASRAMQRVLEQIDKIRTSDVTVLVTGESGTGKELIARMVHSSSVRQAGKFLPINCAATPRNLIDGQLFGFRKGAFTGAGAGNLGIIRSAQGGTLFLDEIGCMPVELQPKLLRFLQEREILPVGENRPLQVDVRTVAATNADLEEAVANGIFREDLFYRLNVYRVELPPLRERKEEVPHLVSYYLEEYMREMGKKDIDVSQSALDLMIVYDWPGNVRQLCSEIRRIVVNHDSGAVVTPDDLSAEIIRDMAGPHSSNTLTRRSASTAAATPSLIDGLDDLSLDEALSRIEGALIKRAIDKAGGNMSLAAKRLGIGRRTIYSKLDRLNFGSDAS